MQENKPYIINQQLLWEYDLETFNYKKLSKIVIERIIENGNLEDWRMMVKLYTKKQILKTATESELLSKRDKDFTKLFLTSDFLKP